jgi:putative DNA primase/helicase
MTPFVGVDLDDCLDEFGEVADWAQEIVRELNSYTEITPSGRGLHIWAKGTLPPGGRKRGPVEMYDQGRFFTVTSDHWDGTPTTIEDRQTALAALHAKVFGKQEPQREHPTSPNGHEPSGRNLSDNEIIARAMHAKNGDKFARLWAGDTAGYGSESEADLALCSLLAFYTGPDPHRVDHLFRQSGLYRDKWDREVYRDRTIAEALQRTGF